MPILPDYLATINNRTLRATTYAAAVATSTGAGTSHYTPLSAVAAATGLNASSGGLGILGAAATAQHMAYRNLDGTAQQQHVMTKHPIPGKSMVNFSLIHLVSDDNNNNKLLISSPINEPISDGKGGQHLRNSIASSDKANDPKHQNHLKTPAASNVPPGGNSDELLASENASIGILLSMKALVQLICNPIVGNVSVRYGYRLPIVMGTFCLLLSSLGELMDSLAIGIINMRFGSMYF